MAGKRLNPFEHALLRPDTYIGSTVTGEADKWLFENDKAVYRPMLYNNGLYQIVREIVSNSIDNVWRSKNSTTPTTYIQITIDTEQGSIDVKNDGYCIPVEKEEYEYTEPRTGKVITESMYPAETFFGDMFSGTNYDDTKQRKTSGRNGMGGKASNIFCSKFIVDHTDTASGKRFFQTYTNNGKTRTIPKITSYSGKVGYTKITMFPDFKYFKYPSKKEHRLTEDFCGLMEMFCYEAAMITGIRVKYTLDGNSKIIKVPNLEKYARLFFSDPKINTMIRLPAPTGDECVIVEHDPYEGVVSLESVDHISFVNGIRTINGGIHVDGWKTAVFPTLLKEINAKLNAKAPKDTPQLKATYRDIFPYLTMIVRVEVDRPSFSSQTKDELTKIHNDAGKAIPYRTHLPGKASKDRWTAIATKTLPKIKSFKFIDKLLESMLLKMGKSLIKKEKIERNPTLSPKTTDASYAGTAKSKECTLYIVEGDSAKTLAIAGISKITEGSRYFGAFPVRGKFLNVIKAPKHKINANHEIIELKRTLGLRWGVDYSVDKEFKTLRYGRVRLMMDADDDGFHILGLLILFFTEFPGLIERGFVESMSTAAVVIRQGRKKKPLLFYSNPSFRSYAESHNVPKSKTEYQKGLGSIPPADVPIYFNDPKVIRFVDDEESEKMLLLGFDEKSADDRKEWITEGLPSLFDDTVIVDDGEPHEMAERYEGEITLSDFINHKLIIYHRAAVPRALPNIFDGLKVSQRKVLFGMFDKNYSTHTGLTTVAGDVKSITHYHHGDACISVSQKVLLYTGEKVRADELKVGSKLMGVDCTARTVTSCKGGTGLMYDVKLRNGTIITVNDNHTFTLMPKVYYSFTDQGVCTRVHGSKNTVALSPYFESIREARGSEYSVAQLVDIHIDDLLKSPQNYSFYRPTLQYAEDSTLPISAITFGRWLGGLTPTLDVRALFKRGDDLHIPEIYMKATVQERINLIRGIADGRGVRDGHDLLLLHMSILHEQVIDLARSVGLEASLDPLNCVRIVNFPRDEAIVGEAFDNLTPGKALDIVSITESEKTEYISFELDGDRRYLLGEYMVDHNSLQDTIIKMAQGFVGSNNMPLLVNYGSFGSRLLYGKDHASPRYIKTSLEKITHRLFPKEDTQLLPRVMDDGQECEVSYFMPILPMLVINGCMGIASGYSCTMPPHNPEDVLAYIREWLRNDCSTPEDYKPLEPWWRGFKGEVVVSKDSKGRMWTSTGILKQKSDKVWEITELPIGLCTEKFKGYISYLSTGKPPVSKKDAPLPYSVPKSWAPMDNKSILKFEEKNSPNTVYYSFTCAPGFTPSIKTNFKILRTTGRFSNMVAIDSNNRPYRFERVEDIIELFCEKRLDLYRTRRAHLIKMLKLYYQRASNRYRFVKEIVDETLDIRTPPTDEAVKELLEEHGFVRLKTTNSEASESSFDYLLNMHMRSMTPTKLAQLKKEKREARAELKRLKNTTAQDMWTEELDCFEHEYQTYLKGRYED